MFSLRRGRQDTRPVNGKLAILVPTYRFDARARHTIAATASLASEEIAVVIADNSENREKWDYLRLLGRLHPNIHVLTHQTNVGALRNWEFLFDRATLEFYLFIGDDDLCTPPYVRIGMELLEKHSDGSAAAGSFLMV